MIVPINPIRRKRADVSSDAPQGPWQMPEELKGGIPRDVALTRQGLITTIMMLLAIAVALVGFFSARGSKSAMPVVLIPIVGLAIANVHVMRQKRLLAEGRVAEGKVLKVTRRIQGERNSPRWKVECEFRLLSGSLQHSTVTTSRALAEGETVTIVYDRENPTRAAVYPLLHVGVRKRQ